MINFVLWLFLGWPAILLTFVLATFGLLRRDFRFLVAGAFLAFPFSLALSGFPSVSFPAFCNSFLPLFLFGSGFFMSRDREMLAWVTAIPFFLAVLLVWFAAQASGATGV
ncbi:MAG: hypothetical protein HGA79_02290 [Anaerolineales bacterium]|jgi:hypothetical protein|nr:hypothetical protein [Anaerolineales bacterium]NTW13033.1 hypothetical protein [Anaerolineales bacterium]